MTEDGCTFWFDGWWRSCCDIHDQAYLDNTVDIITHIDLGLCVINTSPSLFLTGLAIVIGSIMTLATLIWWLVRHKLIRPS